MDRKSGAGWLMTAVLFVVYLPVVVVFAVFFALELGKQLATGQSAPIFHGLTQQSRDQAAEYAEWPRTREQP